MIRAKITFFFFLLVVYCTLDQEIQGKDCTCGSYTIDTSGDPELCPIGNYCSQSIDDCRQKGTFFFSLIFK